jgi:transposase
LLDPRIELGCSLASDHDEKVVNEFARFDQQGNAYLDGGNEDGFGSGQRVAPDRHQPGDCPRRRDPMKSFGVDPLGQSSTSCPFGDDPEPADSSRPIARSRCPALVLAVRLRAWIEVMPRGDGGGRWSSLNERNSIMATQPTDRPVTPLRPRMLDDMAILDQAGWHLSAGLVIPANITLLSLPAKCPELDPVENVWQFIRDNWLSNRIFQSYDDALEHCCFACNRLADQPWRIMSIGLRQWAHGRPLMRVCIT